MLTRGAPDSFRAQPRDEEAPSARPGASFHAQRSGAAIDYLLQPIEREVAVATLQRLHACVESVLIDSTRTVVRVEIVGGGAAHLVGADLVRGIFATIADVVAPLFAGAASFGELRDHRLRGRVLPIFDAIRGRRARDGLAIGAML